MQLFWDAIAGTAHVGGGSLGNNADVRWKSHNCVLGFSVMGIWPPYSDGTDVNAVDVAMERNLVASANDTGGLVRVSNMSLRSSISDCLCYPC